MNGHSAEKDVSLTLLAGVRCQVLHGQIVGASCVNCQSWAEHIGRPFWEPSLTAIRAEAAPVIRRAINDPGAFVKRGPDYDGEPYGERLDQWQTRAIEVALTSVTPPAETSAS